MRITKITFSTLRKKFYVLHTQSFFQIIRFFQKGDWLFYLKIFFSKKPPFCPFLVHKHLSFIYYKNTDKFT